MSRIRSGFTLTELLVVIGIICLLLALLFPTLAMIREMAKATVTASRLEEASRALTSVVVSDGQTPGFIIRKRLQEYQPSIVRGVLTFRADSRSLEWSPAPSLSNPAVLQEWIVPPYRSYEFAHPWGSPPTDPAGDTVSTLTPPGTALPLEAHRLGDLTPLLSAELLRIGGILDPQRFPADADAWTAYRTDRRRDPPWNDAWGRPLLLGFAQYHPRRYAGSPQDQLVRSGRSAYGYSNSVYIAGAAVGPRLPDDVAEADITSSGADWTTSGTGLLAKLWSQSIAIAGSEGGVELWRTDGASTPPVNAFTSPPWSGSRRGKHNGRHCIVTAPLEIR